MISNRSLGRTQPLRIQRGLVTRTTTGKRKTEYRALAREPRGHVSAKGRNCFAHDAEAETSSFDTGRRSVIGPEQSVEEFLALIFGDADSVVAHLDNDLARSFFRGRRDATGQPHPSLRFGGIGVLDGVGYK